MYALKGLGRSGACPECGTEYTAETIGMLGWAEGGRPILRAGLANGGVAVFAALFAWFLAAKGFYIVAAIIGAGGLMRLWRLGSCMRNALRDEEDVAEGVLVVDENGVAFRGPEGQALTWCQLRSVQLRQSRGYCELLLRPRFLRAPLKHKLRIGLKCTDGKAVALLNEIDVRRRQRRSRSVRGT